MFIGIIILLLIGGGVGVTAENAVPGDVLYPVKVGVTEELRAQLAVSAEAKTKWEAKRAERRLEEIEKLAAKGELTAEVAADIEEHFNSHLSAFAESAAEMSANGKGSAKGNAGMAASAEAHSSLETALRVHEEILTHIAATNSQASTAMSSFIANIRTKLTAQADARVQAEAHVVASGGAEVQTAAEGKRTAAENKIAEVEKFVANQKASVSAEVSAEAEAKLSLAKQAVVNGGGKMAAGAYGEAFVNFQEAMRLAQEAKLVLTTKEKLKIQVGTTGVNVMMNQEGSNSGNSATTSGSGSVKVEAGVEAGAGNATTGAQGGAGAGVNVGL